MDFGVDNGKPLLDPKACHRKISTINLNYEFHELKDNKRFTCYLTTPLPIEQVISTDMDADCPNENINKNFATSSPTSLVNICMKELMELKINFADLQKQIEDKDKDLSLKSRNIKHLKEVTSKNDTKIKKIDNLIGSHQEKIIRIEGLMHELDYDRLSSAKESDILGSILINSKKGVKTLNTSSKDQITLSVSPKLRSLKRKIKIRSHKK